MDKINPLGGVREVTFSILIPLPMPRHSYTWIVLLCIGILMSPLLLLVAVNVLLFGIKGVYLLQGYYVVGYFGGDEMTVAESIVRRNKDAKECYRLVNVDIGMNPSSREKREACVVEVAKLRKDPAVCALLMPSQYGIYCIGSVQSTVEPAPECYLKLDKQMLCRIAGKQEEFPWEECSAKLQDVSMRDWCIVARATWEPAFVDCTGISKNSSHKDACFFAVALKQHSVDTCDKIENSVRRSACQVLVQAEIKYPELRSEE